METISYGEVLQKLHSGVPFSATMVRYDRKRGGGGLLNIEAAGLVAAPNSVQPATAKATKGKTSERKSENYTRKVAVVINGVKTTSVIDIHPPLILVFDGKKVTR